MKEEQKLRRRKLDYGQTIKVLELQGETFYQFL